MSLCLSPGNWFKRDKLQCPSDVNIIVDAYIPPEQLPQGKVWFIQVEPEAINPTSDYICKNWASFEKIITFNERVLAECPNAVKYIYGTTWIDRSIWSSINCTRKQFGVSSITGGKAQTVGHRFRLDLYKNQHRCPIPSIWFESKNVNISWLKHPSLKTPNPVLKESKFPLFENFQFSLVIENSRQTNYFTEKLVDCLITKTIPIYYGCPNISEFFDTRGWIILENDSVEEAFSKVSQLTPYWYAQHQQVIESNYTAAQKYTDFYENVNSALRAHG